MNELLKNLQQSFSQLPVWFWIFPAVIVVYFIGYLFYVKRSRGNKKRYLEAYPTYSSLYCEMAQKGIKTLFVTLLSIDGDNKMTWFAEGTKNVYILSPGSHVLECSASTNRPGVMYKNVSETYGPVKLEVEVGEAKKYELGFDIKEKQFTFKEL